jgi:hypothetical protein
MGFTNYKSPTTTFAVKKEGFLDLSTAEDDFLSHAYTSVNCRSDAIANFSLFPTFAVSLSL